MRTLSAVLVARDEEAMIGNCIKRLYFADEILVLLDSRSVDSTEEIALSLGAKVIKAKFNNFSHFKNMAIDNAVGEWILIIDADERISEKLANEIKSALDKDYDAYHIKRVNYFYGKLMRYGGWYDEHIRLIKKNTARYVGDLHETFKFENNSVRIGILDNPMHHFSHRDIFSNVKKVLNYAEIQAQYEYSHNFPEVKPFTLYRTVIREFENRYIHHKGWKDGIPGLIECILQPFALSLVKIRLWELQQKPTIDELYEKLEETTL
jgi:glycosyltransferase involved in cell wall biosynthesis